MSADFFSALADEQISAPVKTRMRGAEKRRATKEDAERKLEEKDILLRLYKAGRRAEVQQLLSGQFGKEVRGLIGFMRSMTLSSAGALVRTVEQARWIRELSEAERGLVESLIFNGIARLREKNGLPFWDDPLPGEPPKVFDEVQALVRQGSAR